MIARAMFAALLVTAACGGAETDGAAEADNGGTAAGACEIDADCEAQGSDQCPGGSVAYARCVDGRCVFDGCSSPIGTPCDDDPSTLFEGEDCPE